MLLSTRWMLLSSSMEMPKLKSGLSLEFFQELVLGLEPPLCSIHFWICRSLSSVKSLCSSRKLSSQSKVPSSGRPTGTTTSYWPPFLGAADEATPSSFATSCNILQVKGNFTSGVGPKFTCSVTFLKLTCGKSVFPFKHSGSGWGVEMRTPSMKMLTVFAFGLFASRFSRTATTWSLPKRFAMPGVFFVSVVKQPSESKQTLPSVSPRKSVDSDVEKPTRTSCRGMGIRVPPLFCS
mmetsp:Transcript_53915/g.115793  ORF Transcript_53915/g.115793 Transcript_53915/m.115793 type:complete len:236 (+) Transcript_53915:2053-2760(+)